jgi:hypothetical protein
MTDLSPFFFGISGSRNDINMLQLSLVFSVLVEGHDPVVNYEINGHSYIKGYYLDDGIYPKLSTFVKTIPNPFTEKKSWLAI